MSAAIYKVAQPSIVSVRVPVSGLMEQTHIGEVFALQLGQIHATQTALQMGLGHSIAQRQDILRAVFSGQLAPQDPSDEPVSMLSERIRAERASQPARKKPHGRKAKEAA